MALIFPKMPPSKIFDGVSTPESRVIMKLVQQQSITKEEEAILQQSIIFYRELFAFFRLIDLSSLTDEEAEELIVYTVNNVQMVANSTNAIYFTDIFRVSKVIPEFLDGDKVRDMKYITHPSLEVVKRNGFFWQGKYLYKDGFLLFIPTWCCNFGDKA